MIVNIKSDNPNFISLLRKNPDYFGGTQFRVLKNGVAIGKIISSSEYHLVFQDTKYSFNQDHSSQIDYQSYCNPRVFMSMASIFLREMLANKSEYDGKVIPWLAKSNAEVDSSEFTTTVFIPNVYADGFNLSRGFVLSEYFNEISFARKIGSLHTLEIKTNSVFRAVNLTHLVMMYLAATNEQPWFINDDIAEKDVRILNNLSPVPYFVLYLFSQRCLPTRKLFDKVKERLISASGKTDIILNWGNTQAQRIDAIRSIIVDADTGKIPEKSVIEIGCGEMDYPKSFLNHLGDGGTWNAIDVDDYSKIANAISLRHPNKNLVFYNQVDSMIAEPGSLMLAVEVIEHMPYKSAVDMISNYIRQFKPNRLVITTPNARFNKHYAISGFRHSDHYFELTGDGFKSFITEAKSEEYDVKFFGIGDMVDGEWVSLGCVLTNKEKSNIEVQDVK